MPKTSFPDVLLSALEALTEGLAIFDSDGLLVVANKSFGDQNPKLFDLLISGLSWEIFLREARNRGAYPQDTRTERASLKCQNRSGDSFELQLAVTADDGFVLTQLQTNDQSEEINTAREAETLLSRVLEGSPASIVMSRIGDGQVIYRSPSATALLGSAKSSYAHFANRIDRADFVTALLPDARVDGMRVAGLRADGTEFPAEVSARLIEYRGEDVIVAHTEDLSDEIAMQAQLTEQREQLFIAEKLGALGEMLAGIAHELNNPLSIILGNSEILNEDLVNTPEQPRIEKINKAAERCVRIVRSFLAMARHDPPNLESHSAKALIAAAQEITQPLIAEAGIDLSVHIDEGFPVLEVDEVQITQVLINLITNAADAIKGAETGSSIRIQAQSTTDASVILSVEDDGPGVKSELKGKVFDPLFTTKEVGKGTGVGLSYCHRVVAAHGGTITLESNPDQGATFKIVLPLHPRP